MNDEDRAEWTERITGTPREEAIGRRCSEVFRASTCEDDCPLRQTLTTGEPVVGRTAYIIDASGRRIPISVSTALLEDRSGRVVGGAETFRDLSVVEDLRRQLEDRFNIGDMVSRSRRMRDILDVLPRIAESGSTVLVTGETGTGKELMARALHDLSPRSEGPFVAINCGALPDTLLESELFGHVKGAFTDAHRDRPGHFELAEGGTLFLDEIGEVSEALQVRLLRVLADGSYEPLGGTRTRTADVRVIAATNRDMSEMVREGTFRQDLYYRINVVKVEVPPLRERTEDIPLLVDHFIERFNRLRGRSVSGISREALALLMAHDFPGNVRELENVVEHAFVLCGDGPIEIPHLPRELVARVPRPDSRGDLAGARRAVEERAIRDALARNRGNRSAAARELGMHRSTLFRKMKALGIPLPERDGRSRPHR
jgi:PAS domain S-box-containing protein